jgi:hypothetical protein
MSAGFKVFGPFEIPNKQKIWEQARQEAFWSEYVDDEGDNYQLSFAKGFYLFSLRNADNYTPQYVGMTGRDFRTEVFNKNNVVTILTHFVNARGALCLHLLARPKETQRRFSKDVDDKELFWIEDFIQQMCRIKNPDLCNIAKSTFLLKASIEGLTDGTPHRSERIQSFRNALGVDWGPHSNPTRLVAMPNPVSPAPSADAQS